MYDLKIDNNRPCWVNFFNSIYFDMRNAKGIMPIDFVNQRLRQYGGVYIQDENDIARRVEDWICFDTEEDATAFILKWS